MPGIQGTNFSGNCESTRILPESFNWTVVIWYFLICDNIFGNIQICQTNNKFEWLLHWFFLDIWALQIHKFKKIEDA